MASYAKFNERQWLEHPEYHIDELYLHKVVFEWNNEQDSPYDEVISFLKKWKIKFVDGWINPQYSYYDRLVSFNIYFRNKAPVLRLKLIFGDRMKTYVVCRPRAQLEAIRKKELKAKKETMRKPSQINLIIPENEIDKSKLRAILHTKGDANV